MKKSNKISLEIVYQCDSQEFEKLKQNNHYIVEIKQARNPQFHKKAFAILTKTFENQESYETFELFYTALKIYSGCFDVILMKNKAYTIPKSLSFANMDNIEFEAIYPKLTAFCSNLLGISIEELERNSNE